MRYLVCYSCKKILHLFVSSVVVFLCFPMVSEVSSGFIGSCNVVVLHVFLQDFIHSGRDSFLFKIENPNTSLDF